MPDTHLVIYDTSKAVHLIADIATVGTWDNSGTYLADEFIDTATAGHIVEQAGSTLRCVALDSPTFDNTDFSGYGVLEVDDVTTPTDTLERVDSARTEEGGGKNGDLPDYTFTP